jgi:hypothetical protein
MEYFAGAAEENTRRVRAAEVHRERLFSFQPIEETGVSDSRRERRLKCGLWCGVLFGDCEEATMNHRFDIFKRLPNGNTLWITAVEGLVEARNRMGRLAVISSGEYFVYLQGEGIVAELGPEYQKWAGVT